MEKQPILRISDGLSTSYLFSMMTTKMAGVFFYLKPFGAFMLNHDHPQ
jgi:hypothetical protein